MKIMKNMFFLLAAFSLCFQTIAVYAATPDFSGVWELDVSRSMLPDTLRIETMTLKVRQTKKSLQFESSAKTSQKTDAGTKPKTGFLTHTASFNLESETTNSIGTTNSIDGGEQTATKEKASVTADGRLNLTIVRNFQNEIGSFTMKTNEIWELLDGGNTLKITRYTETPRGAVNAEMYFTKKSADVLTVKGASNAPGEIPASNAGGVPKKISGGGILNGKATSLPKPEYPAAARAVEASGAVNVQVTLDEQGNVISASAASGHPLLRQAAEEAARNAKFAPTLLNGAPVKITGVLVYNFVP